MYRKWLSFIPNSQIINLCELFFGTVWILFISTFRMSFCDNFWLGHLFLFFFFLLWDSLKLLCLLLSFFYFSLIFINDFLKISQNIKCFFESFEFLFFFNLNVVECKKRFNLDINFFDTNLCNFENKELNWVVFYLH